MPANQESVYDLYGEQKEDSPMSVHTGKRTYDEVEHSTQVANFLHSPKRYKYADEEEDVHTPTLLCEEEDDGEVGWEPQVYLQDRLDALLGPIQDAQDQEEEHDGPYYTQ